MAKKPSEKEESKRYHEMKRDVRATLKRPLHELTFDELSGLFVKLNVIARKEGILELNKFESHIADEFIKFGMRLAIDGTEPDLIKNICRNWMVSLMHEHEVKYRKVIEGIMSVQSGENPAITEAKQIKIF